MTPPFPKSGDTVGLIAPGWPVDSAIVTKTIHWLEQQGFKAQPFLPPENATIQQRAEALSNALTSPEPTALWALRGGAGTTDLLPHLPDTTGLPVKWLIGYSDLTALHFWLHTHGHWPTLHAPVLKELVTENRLDTASHQHLISLLSSKNTTSIPLTPLNNAARDIDSLTAPILGGNLSLIQCSLGTDWQQRTAKHILLIEETDEAPYRIHRILTHLQQTGQFLNIPALIFGSVRYNNEEMTDLPQEWAERLSCPVFFTPSIGHGSTHLAVPLTMPVTLTTEKLEFTL